ncbi:MAG: hypothetical protein ACYC5N_04390, partial [Endomicrobiales bacterium]
TAPGEPAAPPAASETTVPSLSALTAPTTGAAYDLLLPSETAQGIAGAEFLDFLSSRQFLHYSKDRWLKMRREKEGYQLPEEKWEKDQGTGGTAVAAEQGAAPLPPGIAVDLPYESQLSISGRKLIGVAFKSTMYDKPDGLNRVNSGSFDMNQELQVRIKGKVGRKIGVNVDFDDTREDKRDISVVYKGDPDEFVQEAAFGDITMSLPSTEFVGYSRQLFGVKLDTKYKGLHTQGFFSRTKGFSEVKRFTGNTTFQRQVIQDTSYIDLKYYKVRFNNDAVFNGSVKVYLDDRNPNNNNVTTSTGVVVETLTAPSVTYTGDFDQLVAGQDYTVDYDRGIIMFRNKLAKNHVVAVDYQKSDGTWLRDSGALRTSKIIKEETNSSTLSREIKSFYSLGNVKIIRDNGRGNFILKVVDQNNNVPSSIEPGGKAVPQYPQNITVDFENGVFSFETPDGQPFPDNLYTSGVHNYNILAEFRYRVKFVNLRPGIVPQSERVMMDGKLLKSSDEYFIDYDAGIVTFLNEDKISENTVIEVSYDYAPFGGVGGSTLVGVRSQLDLNKDISFGSSFIYDFAARTQTVPDIRTTPASLMVWEGDMKTQNIKLPHLPVLMSVGGEYAMSSRNPNIMNKAMVESMEGVQQEDSVSLIWDSWHPASNPSGERSYLRSTPPRTDGRNTITGDVSWNSEEVLSREINPNLELMNTEEKQQVLSIDYSLARSTEVSLVQSLSSVGLDFSKKLYLETWIKGDGGGEELAIAYGSFSEDADGDGKLDTEDVNPADGTLNSGEDIGWEFNNPDGTTSRVGAGNGKIDSEDRDANGTLTRFDTIAQPGPYGPANGKSIVDDQGNTYSKVTWTGWKHFKMPLNITRPDDWKAIKQARLTLRGENRQSGNIKIA